MADLIYIPSSYLLFVFSDPRTASVRTVALRGSLLARHLAGCSRFSSKMKMLERCQRYFKLASWVGSARCSSVCGDGSSLYIQLDLCEFKLDLYLKRHA